MNSFRFFFFNVFQGSYEDLLKYFSDYVEESAGNRRNESFKMLKTYDIFFSLINPSFKKKMQKVTYFLPGDVFTSYLIQTLKYKTIFFDLSFSFLNVCTQIAKEKKIDSILIGTSEQALQNLFNNLKRAFPLFTIVGRYSSMLFRNRRLDIIQLIQKLEPHFVLSSLGNRHDLNLLSQVQKSKNGKIFLALNKELSVLGGEKKEIPSGFRSNRLIYFYFFLLFPPRILLDLPAWLTLGVISFFLNKKNSRGE